MRDLTDQIALDIDALSILFGYYMSVSHKNFCDMACGAPCNLGVYSGMDRSELRNGYGPQHILLDSYV